MTASSPTTDGRLLEQRHGAPSRDGHLFEQKCSSLCCVTLRQQLDDSVMCCVVRTWSRMHILHFSVANNPHKLQPRFYKVARSTTEVVPSEHAGSRIAARDRSYSDVHVYPLRHGIEAPVKRPKRWYICILCYPSRPEPAVCYGSGSAGPATPTFSILGE
jgi:hypothetical protein